MKARLLYVPPSPRFRQLRGETTEVPPVDSASLGLGTRVTRRAVASTSGAACTRGSVRAHSRARGITLRNVPQRNPVCGCPRADTLDSCRFPSTPADSACAGLGTGLTRRAVASTSGAACTRGSVRAHSRISGITPRSVPQRNPACGMAGDSPRAGILDSC